MNLEESIQTWLKAPYDPETQTEIQKLQKEDPQRLKDSFYKTLTFGTGGIRELMGVGINSLNIYTIRMATQGLANYLKAQPTQKRHSVFIGYDSRHHSKEFAEETAKVLAGNDIEVFLFKELRPTPLVSFGCRYKKCSAAVMITASHNPPEYNGYKVYWDDGAQVLPPHDKGIIDEFLKIQKIEEVVLADSINNPLIQLVGEEIDKAYLDTMTKRATFSDDNHQHGKDLSIIYTNLHGTGLTITPQLFERWGFTQVSPVKEQSAFDGDFPHANPPNPEDTKVLAIGAKQMEEQKGDILIANDLDADRVGVMVMHKRKPTPLTGNQMACILLYHLLQKEQPKNTAAVKTIVTSELFAEIGQGSHIAIFEVLTGFKYIAEKIREWESQPNGHTFLFGAEESYGYLLGTDVRDKDAPLASCLIAEAALHAKRENKTFIDLLHEIYQKFSIHREGLHSLKFSAGEEGMKQRNDVMEKLRKETPKQIGNTPIIAAEDYKTRKKIDLKTKQESPLALPESDVLRYWLDDGTKIVIRPSGTEPKVKLYVECVEKNTEDLEKQIASCDAKVQTYIDTVTQEVQV